MAGRKEVKDPRSSNFRSIKHAGSNTLMVLVHIITFPYYRFFQFNTMKPIHRLAACKSRADPPKNLQYLIAHWRARKQAELHFISIACAILAAAVIGSFSWSLVQDAYWLSQALWYSSLVLSILGILVSAQQVAVLDLLGPLTTHGATMTKASRQRDPVDIVSRYIPLLLTEAQGHKRGGMMWRPRWKMVFIWQCPIMFMGYSVCTFLAGLTLYVCTPLIRGQRSGEGAYIAWIFLAVSALFGSIFMFASFWIYHYIDFKNEFEDRFDVEMDD